jgi:hypothetical protein
MKYLVLILVIIFLFNFTTHAQVNLQNAASGAVSAMGTYMVVNTAIGKEAETLCGSTNLAACVLAGAAFTQAIMNGQDANRARRTEDLSRCTGAFCTEGDPNNTNPPPRPPPSGGGPLNDPIVPNNNNTPTVNAVIRDAQEGLNRLRSEGFEFNGDTIKLPNGKTVSAASLNSPSGFSSFGADQDDIDAINKILNKDHLASDKAKKLLSLIANELEGGGGGPRNKNLPRDKEFNYAQLLRGLNGRDPASIGAGVAGLEKKLGNDSIGIANDNIFLMVNRRYQSKKTTLVP